MNPTTEDANRKLGLFGIPGGETREDGTVRGILARLLAAGAVSLGELQTARDIVGRKPGTDPHAYLFLAAMFASLRDGNTAFDLGRKDNGGGGLLADACRRRADGEDAKDVADGIRAAVAAAWDKAVAAAAPLEGDIVRKDARGFWYFDKYGAAVQEVGRAIRDRIVRTGDLLSDAELDAVACYRNERGEEENLDADQRRAVRAAVENRFTVVTGGPGTGKTTVLCSILRALFAKTGLEPADVALAAPTARAGRRIGESLAGQRAKAVTRDRADADVCAALSTLSGSTVHRLLGGYKPNWAYDADNPLPHRVVVVDECSMVDLLLMRSLLAALRKDCRLVLLGDKNQLPSVDAGAVLGDLTALLGADAAASGAFVELKTSHRFKGRLKICADEINGGSSEAVLSPESRADGVDWVAPPDKAAPGGCFFHELGKPAESDAKGKKRLRETVDGLLSDWAAAHGLGKGGKLAGLAAGIAGLGKPLESLAGDDVKDLFEELERSRILAVVRKGPFGVEHANELLLRERLGRIPAEPLVESGIPVIVTKNSPALDNGDVGVTVKRGKGDVVVLFPRGKGVVACPVSQLPEHELAYAITVHKSQGSEYGDVLVVLPDDEEHPLLSRQLVYTGITRAKQRAVILGTEDALKTAIETSINRDTGIVLA